MSEDVDIDYGQRWKVNGDRESENTNPVDHTNAPKRGFIFEDLFVKSVLTLNLMEWQQGEIYLGHFDKGEYDVIPEIVFRVAFPTRKEQGLTEFAFDPKDPIDKGTHFTQTVTYHPCTNG